MLTSLSNLNRKGAGVTTVAPALSVEQIGHIRNVIRLSRQLPGDWSDMGPFDPTNEGDDAYRYQLAYMAYSLAVTQYHYLPAHRELLRDTFRQLITKMLRHDVWAYWELTSRGSKVMNPDLTELVEGWVDPVSSKNVMYSGHLLMMVSLYEMLYRDGYYAQPGSLTFECRPPFRGLGPQDFEYDHHSLATTIASQFSLTHGLGCECEPNGVFVYCNQFPMLGLLNYDHVYGTNIGRPLLEKFRRAWAEKTNLFDETNMEDLPVFYAVQQDEVITEGSTENKEAASVVSWGPLIHVWEPEYIEKLYATVIDDVRKPTAHGYSVRLESFHRTHLEYQSEPGIDKVDPMMLGVHNHGMLALLASEIGDADTVEKLLAHADACMNPTWRDGGLFYPRCDDLNTESYVTCVMGNALLGFARLNMRNGWADLFNHPWGDEVLDLPQLIDIPYPRVVVRSAHSTSDTLVATLSSTTEVDEPLSFNVTNFALGDGVECFLDGELIGSLDESGAEKGALRWDADQGLIHVSLVLSGTQRCELRRLANAS